MNLIAQRNFTFTNRTQYKTEIRYESKSPLPTQQWVTSTELSPGQSIKYAYNDDFEIEVTINGYGYWKGNVKTIVMGNCSYCKTPDNYDIQSADYLPPRPETTEFNDPRDQTPLNGGCEHGGKYSTITTVGTTADGDVSEVRQEHGAMWKGVKGLMIYTHFKVYNLQGQNCRLIVYFYLNGGEQLQADHKKYDDENNNLVTSDGFYVRSGGLECNGFRLFIPNEALQAATERISKPLTLKFYVSLQNADNKQIICSSWQTFDMK